MMMPVEFEEKSLSKIKILDPKSHKGDNGRILVIGGSSLFHSASIWAAELAAHFVDHVFYYSPTHINREVLINSKTAFKNGFIVNATELESYVQEADVILIGPGLRRQEQRKSHSYKQYLNRIDEIEKLPDEPICTYLLTNTLIAKYPQKKWVIDAGALQEVELDLVSPTCVLTPHQQEFGRLFPEYHDLKTYTESQLLPVMENVLNRLPATWLLKRKGIDYVASPTGGITRVIGGNEGLVKGGTGDLLAALTAVLYVKNNAIMASSVASHFLKKAADQLYSTNGPLYTTTELLQEIPKVLWKSMSKNRV